MINEVINYVFLFLMIILIIIIITQILKIKKLNEVNAKLTLSNLQSPFDPLIASGKGMDVINSFLRTSFLKFINNKLITLNEASDTPINQLLSSVSNDNEMSKLSMGYVAYVYSMMSKNMKSFFNRYYSVLDENGEINHNFTQYVTDWFVLAIREIQAELTATNSNEDYSLANNIKINANIFADIELSLYKDLKILEETNNEQKK